MATGRLAIARFVLSLASAAALALLLDASPAAAVATASASFNGASDVDAADATTQATVLGAGPAATGDAVASADVTTGVLRARTIGASADGPGGFVDADASAGIEEALFLTPVDGAPSTPVPFAVFMDLDGVLEVGGVGLETSLNLQSASARAAAQLSIGGFAVTNTSPASFAVTRLVQASAGVVQSDFTEVQHQQNTAGPVFDDTFDQRLTASAMVTPGSAFSVLAVVTAEASADPGFSPLSDMMQTGRLGVVVPDGYVLGSTSGLFLTAPEPGSVSGASALAALARLARLRATRRGPKA